jgi:TadE-like protein
MPVLLLILLGAIDFGRLMQARLTSEAAVRTGASWGATNLDNANGLLAPDYGQDACGSGGPTCNIESRACAEAVGLPGFNGGAALQGNGQYTYQACATGSTAGVCQAGAGQTNPFLAVTWQHPPDASHLDWWDFTAAPNGRTIRADAGDRILVQGTFCFTTFFPYPEIIHRVTWTSSSSYVIQP